MTWSQRNEKMNQTASKIETERERVLETLKIEIAKVGLQMVHGIPLSPAQTRTIDDCLETISIYAETSKSREILQQLKAAIESLLANHTSEDPVRRAGLALHFCDILKTPPKKRRHMIRDASTCTDCEELRVFLLAVADDVDHNDEDLDDDRVRELETCADNLVELIDDINEEYEEGVKQEYLDRVQHDLDTIIGLLPNAERAHAAREGVERVIFTC